ncbi:MAG: B12-binding domain-containing radical SAM protein, partial [Oligoflexia bacterium]|nr:B12-binding domain-containing radical SAM protein [Oligoflexia bacterium]
MKNLKLTKIILISPPIEDFYDTDIRHQPISLSLLKASIIKNLKNLPLDVIIKDYHHGYSKKTIPWPSEFNYLKKYYEKRDQSPFSSFHQYYRFGASIDEILNDLQNLITEDCIVGFTCSFSPYY